MLSRSFPSHLFEKLIDEKVVVWGIVSLRVLSTESKYGLGFSFNSSPSPLQSFEMIF